MKEQPVTGLKRLIAAFGFSKAGLRDIWQREDAFRQEVILFFVAIPLALWLSSGVAQFGLLMGSILLMIIVEILNSAMEAIVDRIGPEIHELSRIAKDLGSAAVLLTALFPLCIWGAVVLGRLGVITL
ncbi:diacylglycerol kinase [Algirhabdus cladophorae]|uniref:diacylglycerol kinase n=1 Tax=Algirhabdus cladophorae TaxID=3377108 RepID=UPI003B84A3FE